MSDEDDDESIRGEGSTRKRRGQLDRESTVASDFGEMSAKGKETDPGVKEVTRGVNEVELEDENKTSEERPSIDSPADDPVLVKDTVEVREDTEAGPTGEQVAEGSPSIKDEGAVTKSEEESVTKEAAVVAEGSDSKDTSVRSETSIPPSTSSSTSDPQDAAGTSSDEIANVVENDDTSTKEVVGKEEDKDNEGLAKP